MSYTETSVPNLKIGDVVLTQGLRVRLDSRRAGDHAPDDLPLGKVHHFCGTVLNREKAIASGISPDFLYDRATGRNDVWCIQGNDLRMLSVEAA